ncbi:hypothetical protein GCM10027601_18420 [Nocardioides ungokensis]
MKRTTSTRNTTRPVAERLATSWPQLAPIVSWEIALFGSTPVSWTIVSTTLLLSALERGSVWTRMAFEPDVVTTGAAAPLMPVPATALRRLSASVCVTWLEGRETVYCAPPVNSMPMLRPLKYRPPTASTTMTPDMAYQSHLRPTKSIDFRPE